MSDAQARIGGEVVTCPSCGGVGFIEASGGHASCPESHVIARSTSAEARRCVKCDTAERVHGITDHPFTPAEAHTANCTSQSRHGPPFDRLCDCRSTPAEALDETARENWRDAVEVLRDALDVQRTGCVHEGIGKPGCRICDPRTYAYRSSESDR